MICGQPRCIDLVLLNIEKIFKNYNIFYYICLTLNYEEYEIEYNHNKINFNDILINNNIQNIFFVKDTFSSNYRNSINYIKKINNLIKNVEHNYDLYIVMRTDVVFNNCNFLENIICENKLYFHHTSNNEYTKNATGKINDNIIITKKYMNLLPLINILNNIKHDNYFEILLYDFITINNINFELISIDYKLILSICNIISIAGDSGSGKSTLLKHLKKLFYENKCIELETDRYHKWERGDKHYENITHLNPEANYLEKMNNDVYQLKIGSDIFSVDYNHDTGKFTEETKIESKDNILLCGLHTLYGDINKVINLKIYMDTDRNLIKKWKIKRDTKKRGYTIEKILEQINKRENDYEEFIKIQKENADLIINFFEKNNDIYCKLLIKNKNFFIKIINGYLKNTQNAEINNDNLIITISDNYYDEILKIIKSIYS